MVYLQAKASNIQLPFVDPIVEFDVFTTHPTQLHMQQRLNATSTHLYFYVTKSGRNRNAGNGFWHASTVGKDQVDLHEYTLPEAHNMSSKGHKIWKTGLATSTIVWTMIKELHDEVYDVDGNSQLEIDEQPFPKRVKY
ncbi:hypothetical protein Sjap_005533 [Stephania japonica]|uniref:NAC domain-containing protein n=1 Tax=Stephania japonica TaxID=461633 RepID=A0AAP0PL81_9MAGN